MIKIETHVDENDVSAMHLEMSGTGMDLLADALAIVKRLADAFEKQGGRFVKTMFVEMLKDDGFWELNIDAGEDEDEKEDADE
jgi:hypothetical protein